MGTLYENIKELCQEHGIAPSNLGYEITGSKAFMTELKMGRKKGISAGTAQKIADYFGVSVDRVLYGKRDDPEKSVEIAGDTLEDWLEDARSRPELRVLYSATKGMTREQVEKMAGWISEMRKGWEE